MKISYLVVSRMTRLHCHGLGRARRGALINSELVTLNDFSEYQMTMHLRHLTQSDATIVGEAVEGCDAAKHVVACELCGRQKTPQIGQNPDDRRPTRRSRD